MAAKEPKIKVKAFAVLIHEDGKRHLVWRHHDDTRPDSEFHRLLGGHLEFGESLSEGIRREILEEVGIDLGEPQLLGFLESTFVHRNKPGHEICFIYGARLRGFDRIPDEGGYLVDNTDEIWVEWRSIEDPEDIPLYPTGTQELIALVEE